jgi:GxxExxY protein
MAILYEKEVYSIIGAAMTVHNELGSGFLEAVYQEALEIEFLSKHIPTRREVSLQIYYKGTLLSKYYCRASVKMGNRQVVETSI